MSLARTPYDGSATPFTIGLKPLDLAEWLEIDALYQPYLAEKRRLFAERPDDVFAQEAGTEDAQREVLDLVRAHLEAHAPHLPRLDARPGEAPLKTASLMVQEDLVLMRRGEDGWRLAAASLCFPSSWSLAEKFGRPLQDIHVPVPGFGPGTRNETVIGRIFDNLAVDRPVERANWSLQDNPALYHPLSNLERGARAGDRPLRFGPGDPAAADDLVATTRKVLEAGLPLFGICFGNQILGRAFGLDTYKLKFGHRGINVPVQNIVTGKIDITSQNHGFAIEAPAGESFDTDFGRARVTHVCLNDQTVEGVALENGRAFSVQYHPESAAGPRDANPLFDQFIAMMDDTAAAGTAAGVEK